MEESNGSNTFKCRMCSKKHIVPSGGFKTNSELSIELELNMHLDTEEKKEAKLEYEKLAAYFEEKAELIRDPSLYLFDIFTNIINQIDQQKLKMIEMVKEMANQLKETVKQLQEGLPIIQFYYMFFILFKHQTYYIILIFAIFTWK